MLRKKKVIREVYQKYLVCFVKIMRKSEQAIKIRVVNFPSIEIVNESLENLIKATITNLFCEDIQRQ